MATMRERQGRDSTTPGSEQSMVEKTPGPVEQGLSSQASNTLDPEIQIFVAAENDTFGNEDNADIQYKTCKWWHTSVLMLAENMSLGVLALPQVLAILGLVPGLLCLFFLGIIATYTGLIIGNFKLAHREVHSFADCGMLIAGPIGREVMAICQVLILIFIMGAHVLSFSIAMNAITDHAMCTVVWCCIGLILCLVLGLPRTFKNVSYLSIVSCVSIILAVLLVMIAIGIQKPDMDNVLAVRPNVPLVKGIGPVLNIILAYTGHVAFFSFQAELKDPRDFKKAILLEQSIAVTFYLTISFFIYYYAGPLVASPALGSANPLVTKIAFGIALPTIIIGGVVNGSVACKYVYVRMWKGTNVVHQTTFQSMGSWYAICALAWTVSWILAEAIPNFNIFLGLIGAMFGSWFSYALPPCLWLYQYKDELFVTKRRAVMTVLNCFLFILGAAMFGLGMWSSTWELKRGAAGKSFSCANNWAPKSWVVEE